MQRHGWSLYAHPLFLAQLDRLATAVEHPRRNPPDTWQHHPDARLLATISALTFDRIPRDPLDPTFRQGNTLGLSHRHWFHAKFAATRFRLFYRRDSTAKIIVYAWVNDRDTPPDDWPTLLAEPGMAELLAAVPTLHRLLNPIRHIIGLPTVRKPRPKPEPKPNPPRPRLEWPLVPKPISQHGHYFTFTKKPA